MSSNAKAYGLTAETDAILSYAYPENTCHICLCQGEVLHIDHDHRTGNIRGYLCRACNHGVGNFRDSPELLSVAIAYLSRAGVRPSERDLSRKKYKLTPRDVRKIREARLVSSNLLAVRYGVSKSSIDAIRSGKNWKGVL